MKRKSANEFLIKGFWGNQDDGNRRKKTSGLPQHSCIICSIIWFTLKPTRNLFTVLGNSCHKCPPGWTSHIIGTTEKCLFMAKSKVEISQVDTICQRLNATVPYPKNNTENQNYRNAFNSMKIPTSIAIKSCHGIVEQNPNGNWNPFPTNRLINVVCEKPLIAGTTRFKRQANSGLHNFLTDYYKYITLIYFLDNLCSRQDNFRLFISLKTTKFV